MPGVLHSKQVSPEVIRGQGYEAGRGLARVGGREWGGKGRGVHKRGLARMGVTLRDP